MNAPFHAGAGVQSAAAIAGHENGQVAVSVAVAVGVAAAVDDGAVVQNGLAIRVFFGFQLRQKCSELFHVEAVDPGDLGNHVRIVAVVA